MTSYLVVLDIIKEEGGDVMSTYKVYWCDIHNTCGGCAEVIANDAHDAVCRARRIVQLGCNFCLVRVYAVN